MIYVQYTNYDVRLPDYIYNVDVTFQYHKASENGYNTEIDTELMRLIDGIDKRMNNVIFYGEEACPIEYLSTGTKAAILALHGFKVFSDCMGPNAFSKCIGVACKYNKDIWLHMVSLQDCRYVGTSKMSVNGKIVTLDNAGEALIEAHEEAYPEVHL